MGFVCSLMSPLLQGAQYVLCLTSSSRLLVGSLEPCATWALEVLESRAGSLWGFGVI